MLPERVKNPRCDGDNCRRTWGIVKKLPSGDGNMILCYWCWVYEKRYQQENGFKDTPNWRDLEVYKEV